jgi:hypothetical protein
VPDFPHIDPAWLTALLRQGATLRTGRVEHLDLQVDERMWSRIVRAQARYSADATGECPPRVLIKQCAGVALLSKYSEFDYYTRDYVDCQDAPVPRCYGAQCDADSGDYSLVLDDLTDTHAVQLAPSLDTARGVASAMAHLHVHRWGAPSPEPATELPRYFARITEAAERLGADLPEEWRASLRVLLARHPQLAAERARDAHGLTLVHGDLNPGNILLPTVAAGRVYVIDRQAFVWSLRRWLGIADLAHWLVLYTSREERQALEPVVIEHYLRTLRELGCDYHHDRALTDYRVSIAHCIEYAVEWLGLRPGPEAQRSLWRQRLERAIMAFDDQGCRALFEG